MYKGNDNSINDIAAEWVARGDAAPLSMQERADLDAWLAADVRHMGAYERAHAIFLHAHRARLLIPRPRSDRPPEVEPQLVGKPDPNLRVGRRSFIAMGAATVSVGAAVFFGLSSRARATTFRTQRGEIRLIPLDDGSTVTLNTDSEMQITLRARARSMFLTQGEAFIRVTSDYNRPFDLSAGELELSSFGSSFAVRRLPGVSPVILVQEGIVSVKTAHSEPIRASASSRVSIDRSSVPVIATIPAREMELELVWREGNISFSETTLAAAAQEFSRYSNVQIVIDDPQVAALTVTGIFPSNNPAGFARAAAGLFGLRVRPASQEIHLTRGT